MIKRILKKIGYKQVYHVAWVMHTPSVKVYGSGICTFSPGPDQEGIEKLRDKITDDYREANETEEFSVNHLIILSMTRIFK